MAAGPNQRLTERLSHGHQCELLLPAVPQHPPEHGMLRFGEVGVLGDKAERLPACLNEDVLVANEVRHPQLR